MERVIVSLTSFPAAVKYAVQAIKSVLSGSLLPDKVVMYLTFDQFENRQLPDELLQLERDNDIFEIRDYPYDIRSYRKLIPALTDFPDDVIVTVDDDVRYDRDMLKSLLSMHKIFPSFIIAHRAKVASFDKPYRKWKKLRWYHFLTGRIKLNPRILPTGVGGVLYPPHSLNPSMLKPRLFKELAPTTDDLWFWAAAVTNGRLVVPFPFGIHNKPKEIGKPRELSLKSVNFKDGTSRNDDAFHAILEKYPDFRLLLEAGSTKI